MFFNSEKTANRISKQAKTWGPETFFAHFRCKSAFNQNKNMHPKKKSAPIKNTR